MANSVVLVAQNLVFIGRVENLTESLGMETLRASTEEAFWRHFNNQKPALVLLDLEGEAETWQAILKGVQSDKDGLQVVAFGPHEDLETMEQALSLGCDVVLSKGEFSRDLPQIIADLGEEQ